MIIITGGAGFIGSAVIWRLNQLGRDDILVVDHLGTNEKWKNLTPLRFTDYVEKDDFLEAVANRKRSALVTSLLKRIEAILHLGACSSTTELDASFLMMNNFAYTKQLALFAADRSVRFVYASSAATYGNGSQGFSDDESLLGSLRPLNVYGYSKHLFDLWAWRSGLLAGIAGLKYFNVFGPNEYHKGDMSSLVLKAYGQIRESSKLKLFRSHRAGYADGEQVRDFIYVKDAVDMTLHILDNAAANGIFNIGSGTATTWNCLAQSIFGALDVPCRIEYIDMPPGIRRNYQYHTCAATAKFQLSGYSGTAMSLHDAVCDYVTNYLKTGQRLGE
ncbi:MAG: ADP-L-glycero-D-manno-heptose 6-epimerase [Nitrospirae bacterium]|nr:MAG: ADP-L-glycero-D-manno-heptose 6-epimerase [Nitrospirota bacterium]